MGILALYEGAFTDLSEKYYKSSPCPGALPPSHPHPTTPLLSCFACRTRQSKLSLSKV